VKIFDRRLIKESSQPFYEFCPEQLIGEMDFPITSIRYNHDGSQLLVIPSSPFPSCFHFLVIF